MDLHPFHYHYHYQNNYFLKPLYLIQMLPCHAHLLRQLI